MGKTFWLQTYKPTIVRRFLLFWIFKEVKSTDIDKKKNFPLGTKMVEDGATFRYYKKE